MSHPPHPPRTAAEQALVDATIVEISTELVSFNRVFGP